MYFRFAEDGFAEDRDSVPAPTANSAATAAALAVLLSNYWLPTRCGAETPARFGVIGRVDEGCPRPSALTSGNVWLALGLLD